MNEISERESVIDIENIEKDSNDQSYSLDIKNSELSENTFIECEEGINEIDSNENEESFDVVKNDFYTFLDDINRGSTLLLDRLLNNNNIDNYKYIIDDLRKKRKRICVSGEAEEIENAKNLEIKVTKKKLDIQKMTFNLNILNH